MGSIQGLLKRREERYRVMYYNRIAGTNCSTLCELPGEALHIISFLSYYDIIRPFVAEDLEDGAPVLLLTERYGVSRRYIESIRKKYHLVL